MRKTLLILLLALAISLTACGKETAPASTSTNTVAANSNEQATPVADAENTESISEATGMDLSIYPSSNIASFEANGVEIFSFDQIFAKIQPYVAEVVKENFSVGNEYYKDDKGNNLLVAQYNDGEVTIAHFNEYYDDGTLKCDSYTRGSGSALAYQVKEYDINGQLVREACEASRGGVEFISNTIYDYHANGVIAKEHDYDGDVLSSAITYNESGSQLSYAFYKDGIEDSRTDYIYDADNKLAREEKYDCGVLDIWKTYEYDTNGQLVKINEFSQYFEGDVPSRFTTVESYDNGNPKIEICYRLDEGKYFGYSGDESEIVYDVETEIEYYENGNRHREIIHDYTYMENGDIADIYMYEYNQDGYATGITYFDWQGNVLAQVTY